MHQGLSYTILEKLSERLKQLPEDVDESSAYRVCWEHSTVLVHALEQDLLYMGGGKGAPCIIDLSFLVDKHLPGAQHAFRAIVKYPVRFQDDVRVVVFGWIYTGRIDVKVRHISAVSQLGWGQFEANLPSSSASSLNTSSDIAMSSEFNGDERAVPSVKKEGGSMFFWQKPTLHSL